MTLFTSELEIIIPFYDIDIMNIVWHGNYVKYMEEARCDLFSKLNYDYTDMYKDNIAYPVAKMNTKFIKPAFFNQKIIIKTFLEEIEPAIIIKYKIFDKENEDKIFEGETMQIGVDISTKTSIYKAPDKLIEILKEKNEE